jgi:hypothetical protein
VDFAGMRELWEAEGQLGLYAALEGVPPATLAAWLEKLAPPDEFDPRMALQKRREIREAVVERLAASDPVRLSSWLQRLFRRDIEDMVRVAARGLLAAGNPEAAEALTKLKRRFPEVAEYELDALAERDPAAAFELAQKRDPCRSIPLKLAAWLAKDIAKAMEFANRHPDCAYLVTAVMAHEGKEALEAYGAGLTDQGARQVVQSAQMHAAAREGDIQAFAGWCLQGHGNEQNFRTLVQVHPESVEEVARRLEEKPLMCAGLWTTLAEIDPAKAAQLLGSPAFAGALKEITKSHTELLADWHMEDPAAALAWVKTQPPEMLAAVLPGAGQFITDLSSSEWLALTSRVTVDKENYQSLTAQAVTKLPEIGMLTAWCQSLPESVRAGVMDQAAGTLAQTDLFKATALALTPDDPQQQRRLLSIIRSNGLYGKTAAEAAAWVNSLPAAMQASTLTEILPIMINGAGPEKIAEISALAAQRINDEPLETVARWNNLAKNTASALANSEPAACEVFLTKLPDAARSDAIHAVAGQCGVYLNDPERMESTIQWITGIKDASLRQALAGGICAELAKMNPPPEVNQRVQQTLTPLIR